MTSYGFTWAAYLGGSLSWGAYLGGAYLGGACLSLGGEAIQGLIPPAHVQNHGR